MSTLLNRYVPGVALGLVAIAACGGSPSESNAPRPAASVAAAGGANQSGTVGMALGTPLTARVRDAGGGPVAGATVQWSTTSGSITPASGTSDASGTVTATWTLGTTAGPVTATVAVGGLTAEFKGTATADRAARIVVPGDSIVLGTWGETGTLAPQALDRFGNAVGGVTFTFSSSDSTVARVSASGQVTSGQAGVATIAIVGDTARGTARAVVPVQRNALCRLPGSAPQRGAARGAVAFVEESGSRFPANLLRYSMKDVVVVDFDRDGRSDVLVMDGNGAAPGPPAGRLFALRNTGAAFTDVTAAVAGATPITTIMAQFNEVADFNGDGLTDVFLGQSGYDSSPFPGLRNLLLLGTSAGGLQEVGATRLSPNPVGFTHGAASGDIDCDGDVDLVENDIRTQSVVQGFRVQVNAGSAQFQDQAATRVPDVVASYAQVGNAAYLAITLCDMDRDGDPDLFAGGWYAPRRATGQQLPDAIFVNDGTGKFRQRPAGAAPAPAFGATTVVDDVRCADFDGDGWNDLVLSTIEQGTDGADKGGRIVFWRNNRNMTFSDMTAAWAPNDWPSPTYPWRAIVADFNNDGWPDVLGTGYGSPLNGFWTSGVGGNAIFFNRGAAGGFTRVALANWFGALWPIDADGDGRLDLLWAGAIQTPDQPPQALPRLYLQR